MTAKLIRIATRKSPLALWQANYVKKLLEIAHPDIEVEINGLLTEGDKLLATPLAEIGGKGLFVKELEKAILERRADIAVHSVKDMPAELLDELILAVVCVREDPRDVLVSNAGFDLNSLPFQAVVGTSSARRTCQLKALRPDIQVQSLRGNVGTRLQKLDEGKYDALILAAAGLKRLQLEKRILHPIPIDQMLPAVGQGVIGIECHIDNHTVREWLASLEDPVTRLCVTAERSMNFYLNGGCQLPIAAYASLHEDNLYLRGLVGKIDGSLIIRSEIEGSASTAEQMGKLLAEDLLKNGAGSLIA